MQFVKAKFSELKPIHQTLSAGIFAKKLKIIVAAITHDHPAKSSSLQQFTKEKVYTIYIYIPVAVRMFIL